MTQSFTSSSHPLHHNPQTRYPQQTRFSECQYAESSQRPFAAAIPNPDSTLVGYRAADVCLDFEELENFDVVQYQFEQWGVRFDNAIALHPSNPAFPPHSGMMVLMSAPKAGWLEIEFSQPVQAVGGYITSSRPARMVAFDHKQQVLKKAGFPSANLAHPQSAIAPNSYLAVQSANIHRVVLHALGGQLTLDDLKFCF